MSDHAELRKQRQVLADFGDLAIRADNLDEVLTEACRLVGDALGTGRAKVLEIQQERRELFVRAGVGWAPDVVGIVRLQMSDRSSETFAIEAGEPVISQNIAVETRFDIPEFMKAAGVVALINVPILVPGGRAYGVLQVDAMEPRDFGDDEIQFLRTYATILGPVIDRLHLVEERTEISGRLRSSEARHCLLIESWAQAVWELDANGFVVADSPSWRAYTGQAPEEWLGYGWLNAIHPDDRAYAEQQWQRAVATRSLVDAEYRLRTPDGVWHWTNVRAAPVLDRDGAAEKWVGMNIDIDARKQAETALRESEEHLEAELKYATLLHGLSARLVTEGSETAIHQEILSAAIAIVKSDAGTVQVYDPASGSLILLAAEGIAPVLIERFQRVDCASSTACGIALRVGRRTFVDYDEVQADEACRMHVEAGIRSAQATPLLSRDGSPIGMINTHWRTSQHRPSEDQLRYLDLLARQAADLIERARAEAALRKSEQALASDLANAERLRSLSERLMPEENLQSICDELLAATIAIARGDAGTIQIYDPASRSLELIVSQNLSNTITDYFQRVDAGSQTACGIALKTGDYAFADFPEQVEDLGCQLLVGEGIQSAVAYPLMSRIGTPLGMLNAHWRRAGHRPNEQELRFLGLLARQAADLIEQRRNQTALRESEERQRALIEGVPQLVWRADSSGFLTWASPQWAEFTGQREDDSRGWGWLEVLHPDDRAAARDAWINAAVAGQLKLDHRICSRGTGAYRWFQTRAMPLRDDQGQVVEWLGTSTDVDDLRGLRDRQQVLVAELQHRTRNLMGVVRSLANKTARASADLPDFRDRFRKRLEALARAQGLLSRLNDHDRVTFDELVETELAAVGSGADRVRLDGPRGVPLRSSMVQTLAMGLHELATNAVKYGALGQKSGQLVVTWRLISDEGVGQPRLHIDWQESGVMMPLPGSEASGSGQGRELIEKVLPYQLSAETSYELGPDGVHCSISIPVSATLKQGVAYA